MNKMNGKILSLGVVLLGLGLLLLSACSKGDDNKVISSNEKKISNTWMITEAAISDSIVTDSSFFKTCMQDDEWVFSGNHDFNFSVDSTSCDTTGLLPYGKGLWAFNFEEDSIALKYSDTTLHWGVSKLTDSTLKVSFADSSNHQMVTKTLTFKSAKNK